MINRSLHIIFLISVIAFAGLSTPAWAQLSPSQYSYPQNHLPWYTVESEHFQVHFQKGNSRSAQVTSRIAEEVYPTITSLYQYEPDTKIDIILNDRQDYSNGAAYFFDNQIEIWVPALNSPLRGSHDWLWDVISHEFTHIIQLQVAMKKGRRLPALYFQWLSYSDVRRPDVLYGYPKGILTYPFATINVPAWFAEGVAQYQRKKLYHDFWDSHRDMLLRTALLNGSPISLDGMAFFTSKNALERERVYNQGFAFTSFMVQNYGESIIPKISNALAHNGAYTINEALHKATGTDAQQLFHTFIDNTTKNYTSAIAGQTFYSTNTIQDGGFFNFYPHLSPDGNKIAYLSNQNFRSSSTQLFIETLNDSARSQQAINIGVPHTSSPQKAKGHSQKPILKHIQSAFSFSPDGQSLIFSKQKLNQYGERYNDLFIYNIDTPHTQRLTHSKRLSSPIWHPTKKQAVAVQQTGGSSNISIIDLQSGSLKPLTNFTKGQHVYTPAWHPDGNIVYFAKADDYSRNIYRYDFEEHTTVPVLHDSLTNYRDPFVDASGQYLYYAADPDGIFNIYRISLDEPSPDPQKLTNVLGGAFMPHQAGSKLYFSEFKADGYAISAIDLSTVKQTVKTEYDRSAIALKTLEELPDRTNLKHITAISPAELQKLGQSDSLTLDITGKAKHNPPVLTTYKNNYTSFSFYPVLRFDNYSKKHGSNGRLLTAGRFGDLGKNLLRDLKIGTYFSSREVTDNLTVFGGALFGIASEPSSGIGNFFSPSRLTDLDRDLFTIIEHSGLPFIEKRWSPTISVELYNMRRNVSNGLTIEEFPCTSCLPDTTSADIAYNIWEANLYLRSKINRHNLVEIGARYSPYEVQTDGFFSRELQQFIPSSSSEYYKGTTFTAAHVYENVLRYPHSDVAPVGLKTLIRYSYEPSKLLDEYEIEDNTLLPVYETVKNHSLEATVRFGYPLSNSSSLGIYGRGFSYVNAPNDAFYLDYIGGFTGMRSYPYFAIGGNSTAMTQLSYNVPLIRNINHQLGRHSLDKLYLRLFGEVGNGWGGPLANNTTVKTGLGAELRFAFNSYYLFPLKLFISSAYGFNNFDINLPDEFITQSSGSTVQYGNEFIFHFGLTFDFDVLNND
ncbi:PD40 domain-containing protein [Fodinibius halophilus]|uniref:Biopolymer transporter Tol n=1 Tax=Fodinibius halophilus TaxID=1736908 RepID=A0A6M1T971_9BACT|nr:PD40 domain-containing protein [Fodinibius halophilus]NGP88541.1 hypothetical protein [Fodinibius halophilus]